MLVYSVKLRRKIEFYPDCTLCSYERLSGIYWWFFYWFRMNKYDKLSFRRFGN